MNEASENKGFRTPEGYFDRFPDRLMERISGNDVRYSRQNRGFSVPEGYFDSFADRLDERLTQRPAKVRRLHTSWTAWIGAAAAAAVLLLVLLPERQGPEPDFGDLNGEALVEYLQSATWDLSSRELAETLPLGELAMEDVMEKGPGEEQIMDYLEAHTEVDDELYWENND